MGEAELPLESAVNVYFSLQLRMEPTVEGPSEKSQASGDGEQIAALENHASPSASGMPVAAEPVREVSAATIGRMLGLATTTELNLLDGKIDLLATKISGVQIKLDKLMGSLNSLCTGSDLDRLEVQISSIKSLIRDSLGGASAGASSTPTAASSAAPAGDAPKKPRPNIFVSKPSEATK